MQLGGHNNEIVELTMSPALRPQSPFVSSKIDKCNKINLFTK